MMELVIHLPETDKPILQQLIRIATQRSMTIDNLIRQLMLEYLQPKPLFFDDLTALAGTWSEAEAAEFEQATADFAKIDEGIRQ